MASLRVEADEAQSQVETLTKEVKDLKQENLEKEQEIKSLRHQNTVLESEVEKLEGGLKDAKGIADQSTHHAGQNESLQRRLQLLEDEAEEADKNIRESNEKYEELYSALGECQLTGRLLQAPPARHQGWALRAQGAGAAERGGHLGEEVRRDGGQVQGDAQAARRLSARDRGTVNARQGAETSLYTHKTQGIRGNRAPIVGDTLEWRGFGPIKFRLLRSCNAWSSHEGTQWRWF